jgi:hypothetical protein
MKMDENRMIADFFSCRMIKNSLEINSSILFIIILFEVLVAQNEEGMIIKNSIILIQLGITVLDDGSKIENRFLIIFNLIVID